MLILIFSSSSFSSTDIAPLCFRESGLVVRVADWHAGDPGSIPGRDGLYTFGCIPQRFESASAEILRYMKTLI
jgi:hypothetical protein